MARTERLTKVNFLLYVGALFLLTILISLYSITVGSIDISFGRIIGILTGGESDSVLQKIIWDIRLPRILTAIAVGGGLSVAGAVFQAILMNPLAEPYILGISSGGSFGAVLSFVLGLSFLGTQILAFAGALLVVFIVFMLGRRFGEIEPGVLLLSGVMVGAFFGAGILIMTITLDSSLRTAIFWLIGSLSFAETENLYFVLPVSLIATIVLIFNSYKYNVLAIGQEGAKQLGINTKRTKNIAYVVSSLLVGSVVSISGIIGFVGLIIPHVSRMLFGQDYRIIIPSSFFLGASFLILADTVARNIMSPSELPVGAVTAIIGAPVFIYLLKKKFQY